MFDKASLKLGLDKAVLQSISGRQDQTMVSQGYIEFVEISTNWF